jgi:hypothetical protein
VGDFQDAARLLGDCRVSGGQRKGQCSRCREHAQISPHSIHLLLDDAGWQARRCIFAGPLTGLFRKDGNSEKFTAFGASRI